MARLTKIRESFVFLRQLFERRSGTGILPVRFNQADLFGNSRAGRTCHYFGCGYCRAKSLAVKYPGPSGFVRSSCQPENR